MPMSVSRLAAAAVLFLLLFGLTFLPASHRWDEAVTVWLQHAAPAPDVPAALFVFLGDAEVVIPGLALAGLFLLRRDRFGGSAVLGLAAVLLGISLLAVALKHVIPQPGPPLPLQRQVFQIGLSVPQPFSFPSGHTLRTTFIAGTLLRRAPVLAGATVLSMMAALVYLGDHWMTDVLGGLSLGWVCVEIARHLWGAAGPYRRHLP